MTHNRKKITLRELQSLIGLLNFACLVVPPGRSFLRRLIDRTKNITNPFHFIKLTKEARADINAWKIFIDSFNGKSVFLSDQWLSSDHLKLFTDASGNIGFSAVFGSWWFAHEWPLELKDHQIAVKELLPIVLCIELWGCYMTSSDNQAIVEVINKQSCKDKILMRLVRRLVLISLKYNIVFRAKHIAGKSNIVADYLSRFKFQKAQEVAPWLSQHQTQIPAQLLQV